MSFRIVLPKDPERFEELLHVLVSLDAADVQEVGTLEGLKKWWKKKRQPAPPKRDPNDGIVRCQIGGTMQFTRKSDCMLRGGRAS